MASFNRVILMGNLTRDVELKHLPSGMAVAEFGMAMNERRKTQSGEWVDEPVFVDITLWGRQAEVASEYLQKGSPVLIEGRLKYDTWEKEGKKFSKLRVVGERMQMVGPRQGGSSGAANSGAASGGAVSGGAGRSASRSPAMPSSSGSDYAGSSAPDFSGAAEMSDGGEQDIPF